MKQLFRYLRPYRKQVTQASSASILNKVLDLMPPLLVGWIVDNLTGHPPAWLGMMGFDSPWTGAIALSAAIIIIFGFESLFEWAYQLWFKQLAQQVQHDLRMDTYDHLQRQEISFFEGQRTGNLLSILNDDINQLERFLNTGLNDILQLGVLFIFASVTLTAYSWQLALLGVSAIPFIVAGSFWYQKLIAPRYTEMRQKVGGLVSRLENNLGGIMVIKSFSAEQYEKQRVEEASDAYRQANVSVIKLNALYVPLIRMIVAFGFAACMLLGSWWVVNGTGGITPGGLTFFGMMIQRLLWPMTRMGTIFDDFARARASVARVFGLLISKNRLKENTLPAASDIPARFSGQLTLDNVHFSYQANQPTLDQLDLRINPGETWGIAGPSGSGKTTLIKLLLRLYDPVQGRIMLDGVDLRAIPLKQLRQQIAIVSQDTYLFHGTIAENIAYGMPDADIQAVEQAAREAELHAFISQLPEGYDTLVGERGIKLSGGQRQRVSIARAILKDAPILILDEATSAVDSETERAIQDNLDRLVAGRTALIIAHRLSTIRDADQIMVLSDGKIAETGRHDDLIQAGGAYAALWRVQTGIDSFG